MRFIELNNKTLLSLLNEYSDTLLKDKSKLEKLNYWTSKSNADEATSTKYLEDIKNNPEHNGWPMDQLGYDFCFLTEQGISENEFADFVDDIKLKINMELGTKHNALMMIYPHDGFIGWHTNENCPGYNILISYSEKGAGFFRYEDPQTKEIVTMQDKPGWTAKVGYFGERNEDIFWHSARTFDEYRLTCSFVIPHKEMWEMMIEDIECDD